MYLTNISVEDALEKFFSRYEIKQQESEIISSYDALGKITAEPVFAINNSPLYDSSAMDGIALIAKDSFGASENTPIRLSKNYQIVDTGDPIKFPFDAVIKAEDLQEDGDGVIIRTPATPWQNVRPIGEDIVSGEMLLPSNYKIRPFDLGVLLAGGIKSLKVKKGLKVGIIPTGSELIEVTQPLKEGCIIESNTRMLEGLLIENDCKPSRFDIVPDDYEQIKQNLQKAVAQNDVVLICSGTSAGTEDYSVHILREIGEVIVHGVATKPGKPVILAIVNGKPVVGIPGYPVSAYIAYENFVKEIISKIKCSRPHKNNVVKATLTRRLVSSFKYREFVRVKVGKIGDRLVATPTARGAGAAMSLVQADGFCIIPQDLEGYEAGEIVEITLCRELQESTVVSIGSHDLILDVLADMLPLSSTHVGSLGGIMALKNNEAHIAPIHHLDEETGEYNFPILKKMLPNCALIKGVKRMQGIIVQKGNPLGITKIEDLQKVRYINRQRGAGTRMLLDYKLKQLNIDPEKINGYDREAVTHMAVAASIKNNSADAGMGIKSVAVEMGLDFIEIAGEEYDFAIPKEFLELEHIKIFIQALKSDEFKKRLEKLDGYDTKNSGEVFYDNM